MSTSREDETLAAVRTAALEFPETWEDFPWGQSVVKVRTKIVVFLGREGPVPPIGLKLSASVEHARSLPHAEPMRYGLGRHGWTLVPLTTGLELLLDWLEESYRLVAPKTLVRALDRTDGGAETAPARRPTRAPRGPRGG